MVRAVLSGILVAAAFPFVVPWANATPVVPSGWLGLVSLVALTPLIWDAAERTPKRAFLHGWVAGLVGFALIFYWINIAMTTFGGMSNFASVPALGLLVAYCAVFWGVPVAMAVKVRRDLGWPLWIVLPPAWVGAEILRNYLFSGYPWGNLGYALAQVPHLAQIASIGGVYLVAGLIVLVNAALAEAVLWWRAGHAAEGRRRVLQGAGVAALAIVCSLGWSTWRLHAIASEDHGAKTLDVALVQGNIDQKIKNAGGRYGDFILQSYVPLSEQAARDGADLVIWPEAAYPGAFSADAIYLSRRPGLQPLIGAGHAWYLLSGETIRRGDGQLILTNSGFLADPSLSLRGRYDKHHLVPFGEYVPLAWLIPVQKIVPGFGAFSPGKVLDPMKMQGPAGKTGIGDMICYDGIFPEIGRAYGADDVGILVNQTNDAWYGYSSAPWQFLHMVGMRAIEAGRWVARAANTGVSAFIDPAGRVVAHTAIGLVHDDRDVVSASEQIPPEMLRHRVPILHGRTIYTYLGDSYAYLSVAFACVAFGLAIVAGGRRRAASGTADPEERRAA